MKQPCDICPSKHAPDIIYDGATKQGPWAWMCEEAFKKHGVGLGTGKGQKYDQSTGNLKKLEG